MIYNVKVNVEELCYDLVDFDMVVIAKSNSAMELKELAFKLMGMEKTAKMINAQINEYLKVSTLK